MSASKLTVNELGRNLGIPAVTIKKIKNGENTNPTIATLRPIAAYFGLTISQLIGEDDKWIRYGLEVEKNYIQVPLLNWEQTLLWPSAIIMQKPTYLGINAKISERSFALKIESDDYKVFKKDSIIFIDPEIHLASGLYVLVIKAGQSLPCLKKIIVEDGEKFIISILKDLNRAVALSEEYTILGAVAGSQYFFV